MIRTNAVACGLCLVLVGVGTAAADTSNDAPKSLHMRSRPHWSPMRLAKQAKQVAQVPAPDQPPPDGDQPAGDKPGAQPAGTPANPDQSVTTSPDAAHPAPAQADVHAGELSEADFEKLAEQDTREEVIRSEERRVGKSVDLGG